MNPLFHTGFSISDSLKSVRKNVLIYETIIMEVFIEYLTHYQLIVILLIDSGDNMYCGGDNH